MSRSPMSSPRPRLCRHCGAETGDRRRRYCLAVVCREAARQAQREATAAANRRRWEAWRAAGVDPTHGGEAARRRGKAIAESNRAKPRRRKTE